MTSIPDWMEQHLRLPTGRLRLSPVQRHFLEVAGERDAVGAWRRRLCCACWSRRSGKSLVCAARACYSLLTQPHSRSLVVGTSEDHGSRVLGDKIETLLRCSTRGLDIQRTRIVNPSNHAELLILPHSAEAVSGIAAEHGGVLLCDEIWMVPARPTGATELTGHAFSAVLAATEDPTTATFVSTILGSPGGLAHHWFEHRDDWNHLWFDYRQSAVECNPRFVSPAWIETQRQELVDLLFGLYHENLPATSAAALVPAEQIDACFARGAGLHLPVLREEWARLKSAWGEWWCLAIGLDRALARESKHDRTVAVLLGRPMAGGVQAPMVILDLVVFRQGHTQGEILATFAGWAASYGRIWRSGFEQYGSGDIEQAARQYHPRLIAPTGPRQTSAWNALVATIRGGRLVVPAQGEGASYWRREMEGLRTSINTQGHLHVTGRPHDDSCFALLWAHDVLMDRRVSGGAEDVAAAEKRYEALMKYEQSGGENGYALAALETERYNAARREARWARHSTSRRTERWGAE